MAFLLRHGSGGYLAHGIKERVEVGLLAAAAAAGKHGAAGDENGGDVQAARRDKHAGNNLVAAGDENHGVELVALHGAFDRVRDDLAAGERIVHALVVHGDAVAYANGVDLQGGAAGKANARFDGVCDLLQVDVPGNDFVLGRDNGDQRSIEFFIRQSIGLEKAAMRRSGQPLLDGIASQLHPCPRSLPKNACALLRVGEMRGRGSARRSMPVTVAAGLGYWRVRPSRG